MNGGWGAGFRAIQVRLVGGVGSESPPQSRLSRDWLSRSRCFFTGVTFSACDWIRVINVRSTAGSSACARSALAVGPGAAARSGGRGLTVLFLFLHTITDKSASLVASCGVALVSLMGQMVPLINKC